MSDVFWRFGAVSKNIHANRFCTDVTTFMMLPVNSPQTHESNLDLCKECMTVSNSSISSGSGYPHCWKIKIPKSNQKHKGQTPISFFVPVLVLSTYIHIYIQTGPLLHTLIEYSKTKTLFVNYSARKRTMETSNAVWEPYNT